MINLLPPSRLTNLRIARNNTVLRRYIELTVLSILVLSAAVFFAYYQLRVQQTNTQSTLDLSKQKIAKLEPVQKQAEQLSLTVNTIAGLMSHNVQFSEMLTQIGNVMPTGSVLTGLQFSIEDLKSPLVISAQVDSEQKAAILRNNLASSPLFSKADIQSISQLDDKDTGNTTAVPQTPTSENTSADTPYKFTTVINAYFKPTAGAKQ